MIINTNMMAMNTHRQLTVNSASQSKSTERLSSGMRINRAGDDAAGLAISEKMRAQIKGLGMASKNSQDAISLIQTAEGALNETHAILQRMRELAVQSSSDTNVTIDRDALSEEFTALAEEIDDIAEDTQFNTQKLLDGSFGQKTAFTDAGAGAEMGLTGTNNAVINDGGNVATVITSLDASGAEAGINYEFGFDGDNELYITDGSSSYELRVTAADGSSLGTNGVVDRDDLAAIADATAGITFSSSEFGISFTMDVTTSGTNAQWVAAFDSVSGTNANATIKAVAGTGNEAIIQSGANEGESLELSIDAMDATSLGVDAGSASIGNGANARLAITSVNNAINAVSTQRSYLGANQNRLEHKIKNLDTSAENLSAAESRIRDLDMAKEMTAFTKNNILSQAATAMLAQANQAPQGVLSLLR